MTEIFECEIHITLQHSSVTCFEITLLNPFAFLLGLLTRVLEGTVPLPIGEVNYVTRAAWCLVEESITTQKDALDLLYEFLAG